MSDIETTAYENEFYESSQFDGKEVKRSSKEKPSSPSRDQTKGDNHNNGHSENDADCAARSQTQRPDAPSSKGEVQQEAVPDSDLVIESNCIEIVESFDDMKLNERLLRGIYAYGFEKPSAIQQRAVMPAIRGHDMIAQAQSGTGKTASYSIAMLQKLDISKRSCQALVLVPTREHALNIHSMVVSLGDYLGAKFHACIGGTSVRDDIRKLKDGVHVVVGTPGRVCDMINRCALCCDDIQMFVLDEADEMLSRGFKDQIYDIFQHMSTNTQVVLLSATMPSEVLEVTQKFMRDPILVKNG